MDMSQYHELFLSETREHLKRFSELTLVLEGDNKDTTTINELFRSAHSIKGMAASMGFSTAATVAHRLEDLMDAVRKGFAIDATLFDLLLAGESLLSGIIDDIAAGGSGKLEADDLINRISSYREKVVSGLDSPQNEEPAAYEHAVSTQTEDSLHKQTVVKVRTSVLDHFLDTTGELITVKHRLAAIARNRPDQDFSSALTALEKQLRALHDQVMDIRLMPLSVITERFPRMVRDLARSSGKEIVFSMEGCEIELDRSIIDLIGDPLSHILRNSVDHGIETSSTRVEQGKNPVGKISITVGREKDQVEICIADDGNGIDTDKIVETAVAKNFISKEKALSLSENEKLLLICAPGFSTAQKVTDISGRGVGMDAVRNSVQGMGGSFSIVTEKGRGSSFHLRIPLTIAIINVLLVKTGAFTLAIPLTAVNRTMELKSEDIATVDGQELFFLNEETVPIVCLEDILGIKSAGLQDDRIELFITEIKGEKVALSVDRLLGNQEVFVKPLPRPLSALKGVTGATALGSGEIVFIIDILNRL